MSKKTDKLFSEILNDKPAFHSALLETSLKLMEEYKAAYDNAEEKFSRIWKARKENNATNKEVLVAGYNLEALRKIHETLKEDYEKIKKETSM